MKYNCILSLCFLGPFLSLVSCGMLESAFSGVEEVVISLPSLPPAAERTGMTEPVWRLRWYPSGLIPEERAVYGRSATLSFEKGQFTPVIAELVTPDPRYGPYPAAGSIYPALARATPDSTTLLADWSGGIAAVAAEKALFAAYGGAGTAEIILTRFNWKRLVRETGAMEHPEYIDYERLVSAILSGEFRVYDVASRPLRSCFISPGNQIIPSGEEFISVWPERSAFVWGETDGVSVEVPDGLSRFYGTTGCITVQVGVRVEDTVFFMPYSLQEAESSGTVKEYENVLHGDCLQHTVFFVSGTHESP